MLSSASRARRRSERTDRSEVSMVRAMAASLMPSTQERITAVRCCSGSRERASIPAAWSVSSQMRSEGSSARASEATPSSARRLGGEVVRYPVVRGAVEVGLEVFVGAAAPSMASMKRLKASATHSSARGVELRRRAA